MSDAATPSELRRLKAAYIMDWITFKEYDRALDLALTRPRDWLIYKPRLPLGWEIDEHVRKMLDAA